MPDVGGIAGAQLKSLIERIERLEDEKRALGEDIKEVYAEAKGTGFEPKIMRQILKIRKMDKDEHDEQESLLESTNARSGCCLTPTERLRPRNSATRTIVGKAIPKQARMM